MVTKRNKKQSSSAIDNMFVSMRDTAQTALGGGVSVGSDSEADLVGLRLPSLAARYLFKMNILPLSRSLQIVGEEGSAKSALLYEIFRWHMEYNGGAVLLENENKDSPDLRHSILQWDMNYLNRMLVHHTYSLEEWQKSLTNFLDLSRKIQDKKDGPGRTIPMCFGVDSLMATAPEAEIKAIEQDGHASRGYALAANLIARYMRSLPKNIRDYPFTFIGTNHLKPSKDDRGFPVLNVPGGKSMKFMETYEVEMKKVGDIDLADLNGLDVQITLRKNSLGQSRDKIKVRLLWKHEELADTVRQNTWWDWHDAAINLILSFETSKNKKTIYKKLKEITGVVSAGKRGRMAYSEILGVPADSPVTYTELGELLEQRNDILTEVYKVLKISERVVFEKGDDYNKLKDVALKQARERIEMQNQVKQQNAESVQIPEVAENSTDKEAVEE